MTPTPALARATEALHNEPLPRENDGSFSPERYATNLARAAVSAALHDPDDPDWLVKVAEEHSSLLTTDEGTECDCGQVITDTPEGYAVALWRQHRADAVRAAILGEAS